MTEQVRKMVEDADGDAIVILADNVLFGDTVPGTHKILGVRFTTTITNAESQRETSEVQEKRLVELDGSTIIVHAVIAAAEETEMETAANFTKIMEDLDRRVHGNANARPTFDRQEDEYEEKPLSAGAKRAAAKKAAVDKKAKAVAAKKANGGVTPPG